VHAPPGYTGKTAVPVVFDFHGLSGNGAQQKSLSRWDKLGDTEGFIMCQPLVKNPAPGWQPSRESLR